MSNVFIADEDINPGDPIMIINWRLCLAGSDEVFFISNNAYKKGDPVTLYPVNGEFVDLGERFESDNPKTWPMFAIKNRRFWMWVRSLILGFIRKIEDAYDLDKPKGKK